MSSQNSTPLTPAESRRLNFLGYNKAELAAMTPDAARELAAAGRRKTPRSAKQINAEADARRIKTVTATKRAKQEADAATAIARTPNPLTATELAALDLLGYQAEHIAPLTPVAARDLILNKVTRPGSRAHNIAAGSPLPDAYTDEAIAAANATRPVASGVEIRVDEYTHKLVRGDDPLDALINECQDVYPNDVIRLINPTLPQPAGQQFQQIYSTDGKAMGTADLLAMRMPKDVYQEAYVKPNLKRSAQQMGAITQAEAIGHETGGAVEQSGGAAVAPTERHYAPVSGKGLTIAPSLANL